MFSNSNNTQPIFKIFFLKAESFHYKICLNFFPQKPFILDV